MMAIYFLVQIFNGDLLYFDFIICWGYICMAASLNRLGGKVMMYLSYLFAGTLSLFLLGAILIAAMPLFGENFDLILFFGFLLLGLMGVLTIFTIKKENAKSI
jgi:hypothetical protein